MSVVLVVIIQTSRRVSSVVQNAGPVGGGSPPPNRLDRVFHSIWSGFGLTETLVRIQYLPRNSLFVHLAVKQSSLSNLALTVTRSAG